MSYRYYHKSTARRAWAGGPRVGDILIEPSGRKVILGVCMIGEMYRLTVAGERVA